MRNAIYIGWAFLRASFLKQPLCGNPSSQSGLLCPNPFISYFSPFAFLPSFSSFLRSSYFTHPFIFSFSCFGEKSKGRGGKGTYWFSFSTPAEYFMLIYILQSDIYCHTKWTWTIFKEKQSIPYELLKIILWNNAIIWSKMWSSLSIWSLI